MRGFMQMVQRCSLVLPLLAAVPSHVTAQPQGSATGWMQAQAEAVRRAGQRLGIPVQTDRMVYFAQNGATLITAPAANLETIAAASPDRGLYLGVAYVEVPGRRIPDGFYGLRVFPDSQRTGTSEGRVQLVGTDGRVAAEVTAIVEVRSIAPTAGRMATQPVEVALTAPCASSATPSCMGPLFKYCYGTGRWSYCYMPCFLIIADPN
jgi:hypothetical protein